MPAKRGSSPRLRGTHQADHGRGQCARFIPASAGNTKLGQIEISFFTVHPRVCGEHHSGRLRWHDSVGSSPRLRGTRLGPLNRWVRWRFIPASAGNTRAPGPTSRSWSVHPRVCGEHGEIDQVAADLDGSSPRLRGTQKDKEVDDKWRRFIPASAGNTRRV